MVTPPGIITPATSVSRVQIRPICAATEARRRPSWTALSHRSGSFMTSSSWSGWIPFGWDDGVASRVRSAHALPRHAGFGSPAVYETVTARAFDRFPASPYWYAPRT